MVKITRNFGKPFIYPQILHSKPAGDIQIIQSMSIFVTPMAFGGSDDQIHFFEKNMASFIFSLENHGYYTMYIKQVLGILKAC